MFVVMNEVMTSSGNQEVDVIRSDCFRPYYVPERMGFDWILSGQRNTTEDDEDEDEVGEVGVMDEVVAGDSQTANSMGNEKVNEKHGEFVGV